MSGRYLTILVQLFNSTHLADRYPDMILPLIHKIRDGKIDDRKARRWLHRLQPYIDHLEIFPNSLPRPPATQEEIGDYDIEIGVLAERPDVKVGIKCFSPHHVRICGMTGRGKSRLIGIICSEINKKIMQNLEIWARINSAV